MSRGHIATFRQKICFDVSVFNHLLFSEMYHPFGTSPVASSKESASSAGATGGLSSVPGSGRSPGGGHGNPLQCSCLENLHGQRNLVSYRPQGLKVSNTTEVT